MAQGIYARSNPVVLVTADNGAIEIPQPTPLKRLHYFDGKFLRAEDLSLEQTYVRELVRYSNKAGGSGVVHGLDTALSTTGAEIVIGPGMAFDPAGRTLLLVNREYRFDIDDLIARSSRLPRVQAQTIAGATSFGDCVVVDEQPTVTLASGQTFYVITLSYAEALCGQEDVYGKICEEACITSTDRPYFLEGVIVRAVPLPLRVPLQSSGAVTLSQRHLRSQLASAVFAGDRLDWPTLISGEGVRSEPWCLGALIACGNQVPLAVVARSGSTTIFLDAWTVRRERMEPPPRRYWATRMSMRPWDAFLAQVLQFQCQLHELLDDVHRFPPVDLCGGMRDDVREVSNTLGQLKSLLMPAVTAGDQPRTVPVEKRLQPLNISITQIGDAQRRLDRHLGGKLIPTGTGSVLIDGGIIELPPAGYLPVQAEEIVNDQVVALLGKGVDLRFCRVTPDFVPHALEEAQHMDRISLIDGLQSGVTKPAVDILVPNGAPVVTEAPTRGIGFEGELAILPEFAAALQPGDPGAPGVETLQPGMAAGILPGMRSAGVAIESGLVNEFVIDKSYNPAVRQPAASALNVLGAGRGERLPSGGGEFYFAGTSDAPAGLKIDDFVRGFTGIGTAAKPQDLDLLNRLKKAKYATQANTTDSRFYQQMNFVGNDAMRYLAARRGDEIAIGATGIETSAAPGIWVAPKQPAGGQLVMAWTGMRSNVNPFTLQESQSTPVNLHVALVMPGSKPSWIEYRVAGDLTVKSIQSGGAAAQLTGMVSGGSAFTRSMLQGQVQPDIHDTDPIGVRAKLVPTFTGQRLSIALLHGKKQFDVTVTWAASPLRAHVEVGCTVDESRVALVSGDFRQNPAVLAAGNVWHGLAQNAVYGVGAFVGGSDFVQQALALLFPDPPPPPKETRYRATLDWVLFHRRRIKECGEPAVRTVIAPGRRYAIWATQAESAEQAVAIVKALLSNDAAHLPSFAQIAPVEFGAAVPAMRSSPDDLKVDWEQRATGDSLKFGLIASAGSLDGTPLAKARLDQVKQTLSSVIQVAADYMAEALSFVPGGFAVPDTDGAIVFVTLAKPKQTCQTVYRVAGDPDISPTNLKNFQTPGVADGLLPLLLRRGHAIGQVQFNQGAADVLPTPDRDVVKANWQGQPALVLGFGSAADAMAGDAALVKDRANAILQFLGDTGKAMVNGAVVNMALTPCPGATFVFAKPDQTTHRVYVVRVQPAAAVFTSFIDSLTKLDLMHVVEHANIYTDVLFVRGTNQIQSVFDTQNNEPDLRGKGVTIAVYSRPGGGADIEPADKQVLQGEAIRGRFNAMSTSRVISVPGMPLSWTDMALPHVTIVLLNEAGDLFNVNTIFGPQSVRVPRRAARAGGRRRPKKPR